MGCGASQPTSSDPAAPSKAQSDNQPPPAAKPSPVATPTPPKKGVPKKPEEVEVALIHTYSGHVVTAGLAATANLSKDPIPAALRTFRQRGRRDQAGETWYYHPKALSFRNSNNGRLLDVSDSKLVAVTPIAHHEPTKSQQWTIDHQGQLANAAGHMVNVGADGKPSVVPHNSSNSRAPRSDVYATTKNSTHFTMALHSAAAVNTGDAPPATATNLWIISGDFALYNNTTNITLQPLADQPQQIWTYDPHALTLVNTANNTTLSTNGTQLILVANPPTITDAMKWTFNDNLTICNAAGQTITGPDSGSAGAVVAVVAGIPPSPSAGQQFKTFEDLPPPNKWGYNQFLDIPTDQAFQIISGQTGQAVGHDTPVNPGYNFTMCNIVMQDPDGNNSQLWKMDRANPPHLVSADGITMGWENHFDNGSVKGFSSDPYGPTDPTGSWVLSDGVIYNLAGFQNPYQQGDQLLQATSPVSIGPYNPLAQEQLWVVVPYYPSALTRSAPKATTADDQITTRDTGLSPADVATAIATYGPTIVLHTQEQYKMCSVEYFLNHAALYDSQTNTTINHPNASQLPTTTGEKNPSNSNQGRYWFNVEDAAKGGDMSTATSYVRVYKNTPGHTDIQFWFFYAYNGPGTLRVGATGPIWHGFAWEYNDVGLAPMGEHYGDWEMVFIRIDNTSKQLVGVGLSQHGDYEWFGPGGQDITTLERMPGSQQLKIYASLNGHAHYAHPGMNGSHYDNYHIFDYQLQNYTEDASRVAGHILTSATNYVLMDNAFPNIDPPPGTGGNTRTVPSNSLNWVKYMYRWGPEGQGVYLSRTTLYNILYQALGSIATVAILTYAPTSIVANIVPLFVTDNKNGPSGPKDHDEWNGRYKGVDGVPT